MKGDFKMKTFKAVLRSALMVAFGALLATLALQAARAQNCMGSYTIEYIIRDEHGKPIDATRENLNFSHRYDEKESYPRG